MTQCAYYTLDKLDLAIDDYSSEIRNYPNEFEAYYDRGYVYFVQCKYRSALEDYTTAIKIAPQNSDVYRERGRVYYDQGNFELANKDFTYSIKLNPKDDVAYNHLALTFKRLNKFEQAVREFTSAISNTKDNICPYLMNRGSTYNKLGKKDLAIKDYKKAADLGFEDGSKSLKEFYNIDYPVGKVKK